MQNSKIFKTHRLASLSLVSLIILIFAPTRSLADPSQAGPDLSTTLSSHTVVPPWLPLDRGWTGFPAEPKSAGSSSVHWLSSSRPAIYTAPKGPKGWNSIGLTSANDSSINCVPYYGMRFDLLIPSGQPTAMRFVVHIPDQAGRIDMLPFATAQMIVGGSGWQTVTIPWTAFDNPVAQSSFLKFISTIEISTASAKPVEIRNIGLTRGDVIHLDCAMQSAPAQPNGTVRYTVNVVNCTNKPLTVSLSQKRYGWEEMKCAVSPGVMELKPYETKSCTVGVFVPDHVPPGGRETQTIVATPSTGDVSKAESIDFITLRELPSPYITFDQAGWDAVKAKVAKYDWAKDDEAAIIKTADSFTVPEVYPKDPTKSDQGTPALFHSYIENQLWPCAVAWKLTGNKVYAEKVALFLRRVSDPATGYPTTLHANSQGIPQEGGFFEGCAKSYDAIQDSGVLSDADKVQILATFRLYVDTTLEGLPDGGVSNWSIFNLCPAGQCALACQDIHRFNEIVYGPNGLVDQLKSGLMDDGWWYEMSLSYNLGCASEVTTLALSAAPFGIDLLNEKFPERYSPRVGMRPFEQIAYEGMSFDKSGPITSNTLDIKKLWDGIDIYPDYRGIMFGMGDGHEARVSGGPFEMAYYAFRDPAYASIIKEGIAGGDSRDLLYGVPDLPVNTPTLYTLSTHSDNAGLALLRSQTAGRPQREQIQAAMTYGTHGGYHGHFDHLDMVSMMRYGRSFFNPETSWYGYGSYMYKMWVQTSLPHNMVVVDQKMQEPSDCTPLLFHSGTMMQVSAVETNARWSNPPYLGGYDQIAKIQSGDAPYLPIPNDHPAPGDIGAYSDPVLQRRLMIVTDDYIVLADYLKASKPHMFDDLLHLRGAVIPENGDVCKVGHDAQLNTDPLGSGQFITNVDKYDYTSPFTINSIHMFAEKGKDGKNIDHDNWETGGENQMYNEPGELKIDEHVLWPTTGKALIADYPETWWGVQKPLTYSVTGDNGKLLASGKLTTWNLGSANISVDVTGLKSLTLTTSIVRPRGQYLKTIFWGDPAIVTSDGKTIPLSTLKISPTNVDTGQGVGKDYKGGPVRIAGLNSAQAIPAEPQDTNQPAVISIDLTGLNAVRFQGVVGGDWPVGDEGQLRKVCDVQCTGTSARFLTLIEPYELTPMVLKAAATSPDSLRVELADGRTQQIDISGFDQSDGSATNVTITETKGGQTVRTESAR